MTAEPDYHTETCREIQREMDRNEDAEGLTDEEIANRRADLILSMQRDNDERPINLTPLS